jgi:hypothetical protein
MSFLYPSARVWAEEHSLAADVRLAQLEVMAYQRHPEIYQHFGGDGAAIAQRTQRPREGMFRRILGAAYGGTFVSAFVAPVLGLAVLMGDRFGFHRIEAERAVPIAAVAFIVAMGAQAVILIVWLARGALFSWPEFAIPLTSAVMAMLSLGTIPGIARVDGFADWQGSQSPFIVCLIASTVAGVAMLLRFRSREPHEDGQPVPETNVEPGVMRALIDTIPITERRAIFDDRAAALAILHDRGLIDARTLEQARAREPGTLHLIDNKRRL